MSASAEAAAAKAGPSTVLRQLGPGLITGAADDDPSGVATYAQAGAQFGLNLLWAVVLTFPLMVAIQSISARIGRVTGRGLTVNMGRVLPRWAVSVLVVLLAAANVVNIGADLAAMGAAGRLVAGGSRHLWTLGFAALSLLLQVFAPYHRYVGFLKWLTLALLAYVAVAFTVRVDWGTVALRTVWPHLSGRAWILTLVAVLGTTISPYLFFWQSSEEVEEEEVRAEKPLAEDPAAAPAELRRIGWDSVAGMFASNLVAYFIILTTAVTLNVHGVTDIQTSEQAALALRPLAGDLAFILFAVGIIGAGLLGVPVLAGSAAYAIGELRGWTTGLERRPGEAVGFYATIAAAVILGVAVDYSGLNPIRALFWSAVVNGVIAAPIMAATMIVASRRAVMGDLVATPIQKWVGWGATIVMGAAAAAMFAFGLV